MVSKQESLRERVLAFWKMHRRKDKSFTANHFVAEGFLGTLSSWFMPGVGKLKMFNRWKKNQILLKAN